MSKQPAAKTTQAQRSQAAKTGKPEGIQPTHVRVFALQEQGRHRAGRHWPPEEVILPIDDFTEEDLEKLLRDPKLSVSFVVDDTLPADESTAENEPKT